MGVDAPGGPHYIHVPKGCSNLFYSIMPDSNIGWPSDTAALPASLLALTQATTAGRPGTKLKVTLHNEDCCNDSTLNLAVHVKDVMIQWEARSKSIMCQFTCHERGW
ncbi:hypothetical protein BsWGS_21029 [Bradybaena similaris]